MRQEFGLRDVMITLGHGHSKENTPKGRVNNCRRNSFNEGMKAMEVKDGQNSIGESCK